MRMCLNQNGACNPEFDFSGLPACLAADWGTLQPVMVIPEKSVLQETFSKSGPVNKTNWQSRQGTRWSIEARCFTRATFFKRISGKSHASLWI